MKENIYKKDNEIHIIIPFYSKRLNPYMIREDGIPEDVGEHPTLTGLITKDKDGNEECGFALTIDMAYKDKGDQFTDIKYHYWDNESNFKKLCKELGVSIVYF